MNRSRLGFPLSLITSCVLTLAGCPSDDVSGGDETTGDPTTGDTTGPSTTLTTADPDTTGDPDTTAGTDPTDTMEDTDSTTGDTDTDTVDPNCIDEDLGSEVPQTVDGNNAGGGDHAMPSCGFTGGEDRIYQFTAPDDGWYTFDTFGSSFDTVLSVIAECGGAELACNDDAPGSIESQLSILLDAGDTILIVVDSYDGEVGPFTLNIAAVDLPNVCDFSIGDLLVSCEDDLGTSYATGTLPCDATNFASHVDVYEVAVEAGDCLYVSADNIDMDAGATGDLAGDLFIVLRDPELNILWLDDEIECTDPAFGDYACPEGGAVAAADGEFRIAVGQHSGPGCPDPTPYTLRVSLNGQDVDVSAGPADEAVPCF